MSRCRLGITQHDQYKPALHPSNWQRHDRQVFKKLASNQGNVTPSPPHRTTLYKRQQRLQNHHLYFPIRLTISPWLNLPDLLIPGMSFTTILETTPFSSQRTTSNFESPVDFSANTGELRDPLAAGRN